MNFLFARQHAKVISDRPARLHSSRRSKHSIASALYARPPTLSLSTTHHPVLLLYANTYFEIRKLRYVTDLSNNKVSIRPEGVSNLKNGFVAILFLVNKEPLLFHGVAPPYVLKWIAPRGQFIFFLDIVVQMLALFVCHNKLREPYLSFIDHTAPQFVLMKSCSCADAVNVLFSICCTTAAEWGAGSCVVRARPFDCKYLEFCQSWGL